MFEISTDGSVLGKDRIPYGKFEPYFQENLVISASYLFFFEKNNE